MPSYVVRYRKTGAIVEETIEAPDREKAIKQIREGLAEGEEVDIKYTQPEPGTNPNPT